MVNVSKILRNTYLGVALTALVVAIILLGVGATKVKSSDTETKNKAKELIGPGIVLLMMAFMSCILWRRTPALEMPTRGGLFFLIVAWLTFIGGCGTAIAGVTYSKKNDPRAPQVLPAAFLTIILSLCCLMGALPIQAAGQHNLYAAHPLSFAEKLNPIGALRSVGPEL